MIINYIYDENIEINQIGAINVSVFNSPSHFKGHKGGTVRLDIGMSNETRRRFFQADKFAISVDSRGCISIAQSANKKGISFLTNGNARSRLQKEFKVSDLKNVKEGLYIMNKQKEYNVKKHPNKTKSDTQTHYIQSSLLENQMINDITDPIKGTRFDTHTHPNPKINYWSQKAAANGFADKYQMFKSGEISVKELAELVGISHATAKKYIFQYDGRYQDKDFREMCDLYLTKKESNVNKESKPNKNSKTKKNSEQKKNAKNNDYAKKDDIAALSDRCLQIESDFAHYRSDAEKRMACMMDAYNTLICTCNSISENLSLLKNDQSIRRQKSINMPFFKSHRIKTS